MQPSKNTSYNQFMFGDFDKDGIPNADDKYPFNKGKSQPAQEVSLTQQLKDIKKNNDSYIHPIVKFIEKYNNRYNISYRIKGTHSTISKLKRTYLKDISDLGAVRIIAKNRDDLKRIAQDIKQNYKITKEKDYYSSAIQQGHEYYKAIHLTILLDNKPVEIQLKTTGHNKLHLRTHPIYKTYRKIPESVRQRLINESNKITRREG